MDNKTGDRETELENLLLNIPIPNPNYKGKRFIVAWKRYRKKIIQAIIAEKQ